MGICCCKSHESFGEDHYDGEELSSPAGRPTRCGRKKAQDLVDTTDSLVLEALTALRKLADK
jgi:hypothetical protein